MLGPPFPGQGSAAPQLSWAPSPATQGDRGNELPCLAPSLACCTSGPDPAGVAALP